METFYGATTFYLSCVCPLSFHFCSTVVITVKLWYILSRHAVQHNTVMTWKEIKKKQYKRTHNSWGFFMQVLDIDPGPLDCEFHWLLMGHQHCSCYLYLYSIFSLQLASTHSFHSNGLGGIEDWKWHTGHLVPLSLFTLCLAVTLMCALKCPCKVS